MKTAILKSSSASDLKLLAAIAAKMKIKFKMLAIDEAEDIGLYHAMKQKTGKHVDAEAYLKKLKGK